MGSAEGTAGRPLLGGPAEILVQRKVEWSDTDASGHYHNSLAFRLLEVGETALLQQLGLLEQLYGRMPRVHVSADFQSLLYFGDVIDIAFKITSVGTSSITYDVEIRRGEEVCVKGRVVAVLIGSSGTPRPWPDDYKKMLLNAGPVTPELLSIPAAPLGQGRNAWPTGIVGRGS